MLIELKELRRSEKSTVTLVVSEDTGKRYVKKKLQGAHLVYELLKELEHPYLPKIEKVECSDAETILLEEYIEGANLAEISLPERKIVSLMEELCEVLSFLHQQGIIHRDIKPSNLLLAPDGHIRLIDFDAARKEKTDQDNDTRLLGTKGYAPPEQYGFAQTDTRADIYAVGVTMKQLLGKAAGKQLYRPILRKCTEFAPKRRYATANALLWTLKLRWVRLLLPWVVLLAIILGAGGFTWWYHSNQAKITEVQYPDEPLLFYATHGDYIIANFGDLRKNGETISLAVDLDKDGKEEQIGLYGMEITNSIWGILTVGTEDGNWMDIVDWTAYNTSIWERLSGEPYSTSALPDEYYVQITCLDLNPLDDDGMEIVVSIGDMETESVCGVYHYTGAVYEDVDGPNPADYKGRMWGGANFKVDYNLNLSSELLQNPYQVRNGYQYFTDGVRSDMEGEVDYEKYRAAIDGELSLEDRNHALSE